MGMGVPHKHCEVIKAWAEGNTVQVKNDSGNWIDYGSWGAHFFENNEYRIRPEPKPDVIKFIVFDDKSYLCTATCPQVKSGGGMWPQVKVTFDGETGKLKSAEVIHD
jgi:hypothetical protein